MFLEKLLYIYYYIMSFTKNKYDSCFLKQYTESNKSIFNYVVDNSKFINKNECNNYTAPFLTYIPTGTPVLNVDIENELKGMARPMTKCTNCKYHPDDPNLAQVTNLNYKMFNQYPHNKKECKPQYNILPNGYIDQS